MQAFVCPFCMTLKPIVEAVQVDIATMVPASKSFINPWAEPDYYRRRYIPSLVCESCAPIDAVR